MKRNLPEPFTVLPAYNTETTLSTLKDEGISSGAPISDLLEKTESRSHSLSGLKKCLQKYKNFMQISKINLSISMQFCKTREGKILLTFLVQQILCMFYLLMFPPPPTTCFLYSSVKY